MKLYFAEAYTLKENNWAAEIIGYSAEQLLNNEPPRSCPKNRQNRLKEKGPTEERSSTGTKPAPTEAREDFPSSGCTGNRQAAEYRELLPALLRSPNPVSEGQLRDSPLRERAFPHQSSKRYPDLAGHKKKVRPYDLTLKRRLPTLPRENRSTIGVSELNFSVRNGKRWNLTAITT